MQKDLSDYKKTFRLNHLICFCITSSRQILISTLFSYELFAFLAGIIAFGLVFFPNIFWVQSQRDYRRGLVVLFGLPIFILPIGYGHNRYFIDRISVKLIQINPEIANLKKYRLHHCQFLKDTLFVKSIDFLATANQRNLNKITVGLKTLRSFYRLFLFFDKALFKIKAYQDNPVAQPIVFDGPDGQLSLDDMIKKVDSIIVGCKIEVKIIRLSAFTIENNFLKNNLGEETNA